LQVYSLAGVLVESEAVGNPLVSKVEHLEP
jgi:hypothetical protein